MFRKLITLLATPALLSAQQMQKAQPGQGPVLKPSNTADTNEALEAVIWDAWRRDSFPGPS